MQPQSALDTAKQLIDHTTSWLGLEEVMSAAMGTVFVGGVAHVLGVAAQLTSAVVTLISSPVAPFAIAILLAVTSLLQEQWALKGNIAVVRSDKFFHVYQNHMEDWAKQATSQKVYESVEIIQYWMDLRKKEAAAMEKGVHVEVMRQADGYARQGYVDRWKAWKCAHCWNGACATKIEDDPLCGVEHHHITKATRKWNVVMKAIKVQLGYITKHLGDIKVTIAQTTSAKEEARANNKERMEEIANKPGEVNTTRVPNTGAPPIGPVDGSTYHWCKVLTLVAVFMLICAYGVYKMSWIHEDTWCLIRNNMVLVLLSLIILLLSLCTSLITGNLYVVLAVPAFTFFRFCVVVRDLVLRSKMHKQHSKMCKSYSKPAGDTGVYTQIRGDDLKHNLDAVTRFELPNMERVCVHPEPTTAKPVEVVSSEPHVPFNTNFFKLEATTEKGKTKKVKTKNAKAAARAAAKTEAEDVCVESNAHGLDATTAQNMQLFMKHFA